MKRCKGIALLAACLLMVLPLAGCGEEPAATQTVTDVYADKDYGFQLEKPAAGEEILVMHTNKGDISIRLFPEAAPKAVENIKTHAKNGYYNGLIFHRVIKDFMIQGGDPTGTGSGGESIWGEDFADEFDKKLLNLRGSLVMANAGPGTNGSQFFINQSGPDGTSAEGLKERYNYETLQGQYKTYYDQYAQYYGDDFKKEYPSIEDFINEFMGGISPDSRLVPDEVWELYAKHGGNIHLDGPWRASGGHTVFGQVFEGMDVVDAISLVETDENDKPTTPVVIQSIDVVTYQG